MRVEGVTGTMLRPNDRAFTRRGFLTALGAAGSAALLAACAGQPAATPTPAPPTEKPQLKPEAAQPGGAAATPTAAAAPTPTTAAKPTTAPAASVATPTVAAKPTAASKATGTVTFNARGDEPIWKVFDELKAAFKEKTPSIDIKINQIPGDYLQKLQLQVASGTVPDADFSNDSDILGLCAKGVYGPLDDFLKADTRYKKDDYYPVSLWNGTYKGKLYHLPYDGGSYALYYNKDIFQKEGVPFPDPKKPMTWDEYAAKAKLLTRDQNGKRPGDSGFDQTKMKTFGAQADTYSFWMWVWQNGGEVFDESWTKFTLDTPAAAEALQFVADLMNKQYVSPSPQFKQASPVGFFSGNLAMSIDGVWSNVRFRQSSFDWDVAPILTKKRHIPIGEYSGLSMLAKGVNKDAAYEWLFYCCSTPGSTIVASKGQVVPAVREVARTPAFLDSCKFKPCNDQVYLDELESADMRSVPYYVYFNEMMDLYAPALDPVWLGKKSAADAIKELTPKVQKLLDTGKAT